MNLTDRKVLGVPAVVVVVLALATAGVASAALLDVFVSSSGDVQVNQAVTWKGGGTNDRTWSPSLEGGETAEIIYSIETQSEAAIPLWIDTDVSPSGELNVSNYLVTTAFAKGDASATWNKENVVLQVNETKAPAVVLVPEEIDVSGLHGSDVFTVDVESAGDASGQLMIDLDPSDESSKWAQVKGSEGDYSLFIYESEGEFVDLTPSDDSTIGLAEVSAGKVKSKLMEYGSPTIVGVKGQLYKWKPEGESLGDSVSDTVKSITFDGKTYDLNKDDRHARDVTGKTFEMPPLPGEVFDFKVVVDAPSNASGTYRISTNVKPA